MRECASYMDPSRSALATSVERMGRLVERSLNVFHIETTINNRMFDGPLDFLHKNEDDWSSADRATFRGLSYTLSKLPQPARQAVGPSPACVRSGRACRASQYRGHRRCLQGVIAYLRALGLIALML